MKTLILTALLAAVLAAPTAAWDQDAAEGITAAHEEMRRALRAGDVDALVDVYADGFRLFSPRKPVCDTRDQLAKEFGYALDLGLHDFDIEREELLGHGDQVVEIGRVRIYDKAGDQVTSFRFMTLWKKKDGRWRIWRDMSVS